MNVNLDPHAADAPYHAHIYFDAASRQVALDLQARLRGQIASREIPALLYVGEMRERPVGPHPLPQFEIHFTKVGVGAIVEILQTCGLTALVHPLTDDDLADHTTLATWIGEPLVLDVSVLDPPGVNQGMARFARTDV